MTIKAIILGLLLLAVLVGAVVVCNHLNGSTEELLMGAATTVVGLPIAIWIAIKVLKT